jgi:hypothetical protein
MRCKREVSGFEVLSSRSGISEDLEFYQVFIEDPAQVLCTYPGSR